MVDSVRIKEIHAVLGASEFAYSDGINGSNPAFMHLSRKVDYLCKVWGLFFNLDGSVMSVRQSKHLDRGDVIPAGWSLGQFGRNTGNDPQGQSGGLSDEERLGIVYEVKGNRFSVNPATGEEQVTQGGYILCESMPQYIHVMLQDMDRSLGLQDLGSFAVANPNYNPNDSKFSQEYFKYNGLGQAVVEILYNIAEVGRHATQANIGALKAQAISQEILGALGVPCITKTLRINVDDGIVGIEYPAFNGAGQTIADLHFWELMNLSILNEA